VLYVYQPPRAPDEQRRAEGERHQRGADGVMPEPVGERAIVHLRAIHPVGERPELIPHTVGR